MQWERLVRPGSCLPRRYRESHNETCRGEIPARCRRAPEALGVEVINQGSARAPGLFSWLGGFFFLLCSQSVSAWSQSSHCTSLEINSSQTMLKTGRKGDEGERRINHSPPVFST